MVYFGNKNQVGSGFLNIDPTQLWLYSTLQAFYLYKAKNYSIHFHIIRRITGQSVDKNGESLGPCSSLVLFEKVLFNCELVWQVEGVRNADALTKYDRLQISWYAGIKLLHVIYCVKLSIL